MAKEGPGKVMRDMGNLQEPIGAICVWNIVRLVPKLMLATTWMIVQLFRDTGSALAPSTQQRAP